MPAVDLFNFHLSVRQTLTLICVASLAGAFLVVSLLPKGPRWRAFWGWLALYVAGQFCFWQLLQTGSSIQLQLLYYWGDLLKPERAVFLAGVLLQWAFVAWGARGLWPGAWRVARKLVAPVDAAALLLLLGFAAVTFPVELAQSLVDGGALRQVISHGARIVLGLLASFGSLMNLVLAVRALPEPMLAGGAALARRCCLSARFPWVAAGIVVLLSSGISLLVLDAVPHIPDEAAYLYHAKYLASGRLTLEAPPVPEAFNVPFYYVREGRWFLTLAPGWPAVLALGFWIGAPWLINPLLGGIAILLLHKLLRALHGESVASGAVFLLGISPWFLVMNASLMNHPLTLVLFLLVLLGVYPARATGHIGWAFVVGISAGAILHIRSLDAVLAAMLGGGIWLSVGWRKLRIAALATTVAAGLLMTLLFFAYNKSLTGDALTPPMNKLFEERYYPGSNRLGFGPDVGNWGWTGLDPLPDHGPIDVIVNSNQNFYLVNFELFGWAFGSLLFVALLLVWKEWKWGAIWWWAVGLTVCGLNLYWFSGGPDYGARYWYLMIVPLTVLTVRGVERLAEKLLVLGALPGVELRVFALVAIASLLGTVMFLPWRSMDKYKYYRGTRPDFRQMIQTQKFGNDLIFVRGRSMPDYVSAVPFNPPSFDRDAKGPIFVMDVGPAKNALLVQHYANRRVWVVEGPSKGAGRARVVAGPLPPGTIPPQGNAPAPEAH